MTVSLALLAFFNITIQSIIFNNPEIIGQKFEVTDYSAYYVAGNLVRQGRQGDVYDWKSARNEQRRVFQKDDFMPWTYPPQFTLLVSYLSYLPIGWGYLIFECITLCSFLLVLHRLCGRWLAGGLVFALPAILINVRSGQSGFLIATLVGIFLLNVEARWLRAGAALGAMIIKPHLAVAISLMALVRRQWAAMAVAAAVILISGLVATVMLGTSIWVSFLSATQIASSYMQQGHFPLERMTSVYAALFRLGVGAQVALAAHIAVALTMLGWLFMALFRDIPRNRLLALVAICTIFISPYNYDYDLVLLALIAGLIAPDIAARAAALEVMGLVLLGWGATSNFIIAMAIEQIMGIEIGSGQAMKIPSFSIYFLFGAIAWGLLILRRPDKAGDSMPPFKDSVEALKISAS